MRVQEHRKVFADRFETKIYHLLRRRTDHHPVTILHLDAQQVIAYRASHQVALKLLFRSGHRASPSGRTVDRLKGNVMILAMKDKAPSQPGGLRILLGCVFLVIVSGCSTVSYYSQSISGHLALVNRTRPIEEVLADAAVSPAVKARLERALDMRQFATTELDIRTTRVINNMRTCIGPMRSGTFSLRRSCPSSRARGAFLSWAV